MRGLNKIGLASKTIRRWVPACDNMLVVRLHILHTQILKPHPIDGVFPMPVIYEGEEVSNLLTSVGKNRSRNGATPAGFTILTDSGSLRFNQSTGNLDNTPRENIGLGESSCSGFLGILSRRGRFSVEVLRNPVVVHAFGFGLAFPFRYSKAMPFRRAGH